MFAYALSEQQLFIGVKKLLDMFGYEFWKWVRTYFRYIVLLSSWGVVIASLFINPAEAALDLMTVFELMHI